MKKFVYTSDDILCNAQEIFPDFDSLFEPETKGELIILKTPCNKEIPFVWKFPVITDGFTDYVLYEHISGRIYNFFGKPEGIVMEAGYKYENKKLILETIEKNGKLSVKVTVKTKVCRETDARLIWEKYHANCKKPFDGYVYDNPIPAYYQNKPVWLVAVRNAEEIKQLRDILYVSEQKVCLEKNVLFEHEVVLALPDDEKFFPK